jgi:hypothetical protein
MKGSRELALPLLLDDLHSSRGAIPRAAQMRDELLEAKFFWC